jgi:hypothetical protein
MREPINTHAYTRIGPAELGEEWDVLLLGTGQWTRARIVYEFEERIELRVQGAKEFSDGAKTLSTTRQAMRDGAVYRRVR